VSGVLFLGFLAQLNGCATPEYVKLKRPDKAVHTGIAAPLVALSPTEYNQTVRDLFGLDRANTTWWWTFPPEVGVGGFEGLADGQSPSAYSTEQLQQAAHHFASYTLSAPGFLACEAWDTLSEGAQATCGWESLMAFAPRVWRRPLTEDESQRLQAFYAVGLEEGSAAAAVENATSFLLQAPQFIYRIEHSHLEIPSTEVVALDDYEVASRLSYFLWDSMPDDVLLAEAAAGRLGTRSEVEAQARRMLADWRARQAVVHFHRQWLGMLDIHSIAPSRQAYGPTYGLDPTPPLDATGDFEWPGTVILIRHSMRLEVDLFVEQTLFDGLGSFEALMTDHRGYMSSYTEPLYGTGATRRSGEGVSWSSEGGSDELTTDESFSLELVPAEFSPKERAGVLTLPGVLALRSHSVHPAPVLRGVFVLRDLACQDLGLPPPETAGSVPADVVDADSTNRHRIESVTSASPCAGCHDSINPPGFAFENYDALGGWRAEDNGQPVDATGSLTLSSGETLSFDNGVDLARGLAGSAQVKDCYVRKWAQVATGAQIQDSEPAVQELSAAFRDNDSVIDLLVAVAASDLIRYRLGGEGL
jgi:hypothetical protein